MTTTIYFVRHAKPDFSVKEDSIRPLTEEGKKSALKVIDFFDEEKIDIILSSPYKRAIDTIKPFADRERKSIKLVDKFRERAVGCWVEDFNEFASNQWTDFEFKLENGESLKEVQTRNIEAVTEILNEYKGKNIMIGSHGTALSTIINYFDTSFGYEGFKSIKDKMPFVVKLVFENDKFSKFELIEIE